jgi:glutamate--cysteine ligase catalytic subunit
MISIPELLIIQSLTPTQRRKLARRHLKDNEVPMSFTSFPRLGTAGVFTEPYFDPAKAISSHSLFLPEEITNPHVRFPSVLLL